MADVDVLAQRAVDVATTFARRAGGLAIVAALLVGFIALSSYLLGIAALSGSARSLWIILGGAMVVVAIGAPVLAAWRLLSVRRHATELVGEVRRLIAGDPDAERVVIDTVESEPASSAAPASRQQLMLARS